MSDELSDADRELYGDIVNNAIDERTHGLAISAVPTGLLIAAATVLATHIKPEGRELAERVAVDTVRNVFRCTALATMPPAGSA
jgi:hypothetical protein